MQSECEVYVDPEEDEVFFGCMSEKEKTVCAKLVKHEGANPINDLNFERILNDRTKLKEDEAVFENILSTEDRKHLSPKLYGDISVSQTLDLVKKHDEFNKSFFEDDVSSKIVSNNSSVDLEHNYSTPMKHKIDKSILTTPKSIVKADKDGGFLKVLSEIALVKAEAEGDNKLERTKEDEDKENKSSIPEIKITEATPEKVAVTSQSPPKKVNSEWRRFRIIYNSPQNENNIIQDSKSHTKTFKSKQNFESECLNEEIEKFSKNGKGKSIDLIDLKDFKEPNGVKEIFSPENETVLLAQSETANCNENCKASEVVVSEQAVFDIIAPSESSNCAHTELTRESFPGADLLPSQSAPGDGILPKGLRFSKDARKVVEVLKNSSADDDTLNSTAELNLEEEENSFVSPEPVSIFDDTVMPRDQLQVQPPKSKSEQSLPKVRTEQMDNKAEAKSKTTDRDRHKLTPIAGQRRPVLNKYFSERRLYSEKRRDTKNERRKRLPFEENKSTTTEKLRGDCDESRRKPEGASEFVATCLVLSGGAGEQKTAPTSRIPVFDMKKCRLPSAERNARPLLVKVTPSKSPLIRTQKNSKFNHIESPISAYIHNKPTSLVLNVKPKVKKDSTTKVWKAETVGDLKKVEEKGQKAQKCDGAAGIGLPFVEYKSTTPYKIEKRPESRLPRLAPTVMKLIGSHPPSVLKHEGRFYMNSPRKQCPTENGTIVADPSEVSVLVSQPVQKSNTIK